MVAHSWDFSDGKQGDVGLAVITDELVIDVTFWTSLPYCAACAMILPLQDASRWFQGGFNPAAPRVSVAEGRSVGQALQCTGITRSIVN